MSDKILKVGSLVSINAEKLRNYLADLDNYSPNMRVFEIQKGKVFITKNMPWYSEGAVKNIMATRITDMEQRDGSRLITWRGMESLAIDPKGVVIFPVSDHNLDVA